MRSVYREVDPAALVPADNNPQRMSPETFRALRAAVDEDDGLLDDPVVWLDRRDGGETLRIVSGHHRIKALREAGKAVPVKVIDDPAADERWYRRRVLSANRVHGDPDDEAMKAYLAGTFEALPDVAPADFFQDLGFDPDEVAAFLDAGPAPDAAPGPTLADRFLVPPFSVLDARQGYWQDRKRRWLSLGIKSEEGRGGGMLMPSATGADPGFYRKKRDKEAELGRPLTTADFLENHYD